MIRVKMGVWVGDNDGQWRMVDEDEDTDGNGMEMRVKEMGFADGGKDG